MVGGLLKQEVEDPCGKLSKVPISGKERERERETQSEPQRERNLTF
jgi:hypothetical protein